VSTPRSCLNCDAALVDAYCSRCGQRDIEPHVTVTHFVHEFVSDHFGLDSKVAHTLFTLVRYPGRLTTEFLAGRRIRYVPPLRLYLSLSVVFFLIAAWTHSFGQVDPGGATRTKDRAGDTTHAHVAAPVKVSTTARDTGRTDGAMSIVRDTIHDNAAVRFVKRRAQQRIDTIRAGKQEAVQQMTDAFRHDLPDALFIIVPALAGMLLFLYRKQRRSYAEHFVFALHFQAFVFVAFLLTLLPFSSTETILAFVIPAYLFLALRTVYRESIPRTTLKLAALGMGYLFTAVVLMTVLALVVFLG
jgi:hypothetical protein